ncbi:Protocadherin Fat 1, partial [Stegodyphus mimosarum]
MPRNVFKIFLRTLLFIVITVTESNSDARSLNENVFNIFKRNENLPQASDYLWVNSSEIIGPDECVCERGECIVTEYGDTVCQCPPGYGNYTQSECVECKCGEDTNCTFSVYGEKFCICKEGYVQENGKCEKCICGEGSSNCTVNHYGEKVCICKEGYTQVRGKCQKCNCGPHTRCRIDAYGREICSCRKGYRYVNGKCEDFCYPNPCQNGGECKIVDGDYNCTCKFPNSGRNCEKECSCGPNGECSFAINGKKTCQCRNGFAEYEGICKG